MKNPSLLIASARHRARTAGGLAGIAFLLALITGCQLPGATGPSPASGSGGASPAAAAGTTPSPAGPSGDAASKAVCAMFTKADVEPIAGKPIADSPDPATASDRSGTLSMGASCMYTLPNQTVEGNAVPGLPAVFVAVDSKDIDRVLSNKALYVGASPEAVPGLGDEAYFAPSRGGASSAGVLLVRKGSKYIYIEQDLLGDQGPPDIKQKEIALANIILGKI